MRSAVRALGRCSAAAVILVTVRRRARLSAARRGALPVDCSTRLRLRGAVIRR